MVERVYPGSSGVGLISLENEPFYPRNRSWKWSIPTIALPASRSTQVFSDSPGKTASESRWELAQKITSAESPCPLLK